MARTPSRTCTPKPRRSCTRSSRGRALIDGNKRLGWVSVRLFHRLNDCDLKMPIDPAFALIMSLADGSIRDVAEIADRLRPWVSSFEREWRGEPGAAS
jgi:prophage maintenance system killer protein